MVQEGCTVCPNCGGRLTVYDHVERKFKTKYGRVEHICICRLRCSNCKQIHRSLPEFIFPYKQYEIDIIKGVVEGLITNQTLGFEDYPCDATMTGWRNQFHLGFVSWL